MKKKCSENCENINKLTSYNRGVKWECLAQKNAPYVELGDECTAHDCEEPSYDDCMFRNSSTNECGVGKSKDRPQCYRPSTSCKKFSGINYTTWKVILKDKKPCLTLGDTKDKVVYWTGTKSDCEKFIEECTTPFWESITSITENDDPETIEKAKQDIRAGLKMVQQMFGDECKEKIDELRDAVCDEYSVPKDLLFPNKPVQGTIRSENGHTEIYVGNDWINIDSPFDTAYNKLTKENKELKSENDLMKEFFDSDPERLREFEEWKSERNKTELDMAANAYKIVSSKLKSNVNLDDAFKTGAYWVKTELCKKLFEILNKDPNKYYIDLVDCDKAFDELGM